MHYTIFELESTGIGSADRLIEVALLQMDRQGREVRRFETLVNPERVIPNSSYHGISASMVQGAPTFEQVLPAVSELLENTDLLLSFNLVFKWRLLAQEFIRHGKPVPGTEGQCLLSLLRKLEPGSPRRLKDICAHRGISLDHPHSASGKASALLELLRLHLEALPENDVVIKKESFGSLESVPSLTREDAREEELVKAPILERLTSRLDPHSSNSAFDAYFELLDKVFADSVLEPREELALFQRASELGMSKDDVNRAHQAYVQGLLKVAYQDGYYTEMEAEHLEAVARSLKVEDVVLDPEAEPLALYPKDLKGKSFCFSGQPRGRLDQRAITLSLMSELAEQAGLCLQAQVGPSLDFVVSAQGAEEGELEQARQLKVPLVSEQVFWNWLGVQVK